MSRRRTLGLVLLGVLAGNAALFFVYTLPKRLQEKSVSSRASLLRAEVERERRRVADLKDRVDTTRANAEDTQRLYNEVLAARRSSLQPILEAIERDSAGLGLHLDQSIDEEKVKGTPLERFTIRMNVTGAYRPLVALLERLERSPQFITVDQVQFREKGTAREATLEVLASVYFKRAEEGEHAG